MRRSAAGRSRAVRCRRRVLPVLAVAARSQHAGRPGPASTVVARRLASAGRPGASARRAHHATTPIRARLGPCSRRLAPSARRGEAPRSTRWSGQGSRHAAAPGEHRQGRVRAADAGTAREATAPRAPTSTRRVPAGPRSLRPRNDQHREHVDRVQGGIGRCRTVEPFRRRWLGGWTGGHRVAGSISRRAATICRAARPDARSQTPRRSSCQPSGPTSSVCPASRGARCVPDRRPKRHTPCGPAPRPGSLRRRSHPAQG